MNNPLVSFLIMARFRRYKDIKSAWTLHNLFDSFTNIVEPKHRERIEILLKLDCDDDYGINLVRDGYFNKYPFKIRPFIYHRFEGLLTAHLHLYYLFTQRNLNSKFTGFVTDDCTLHPEFNKAFELLTSQENNNYTIFMNDEHVLTPKKLQETTNYRTDLFWSEAHYTEPYPVISTKIVEICGNFGWGRNVDSWVSLLTICLYHKYKVNLAQSMPHGSQMFVRQNNSNDVYKEHPYDVIETPLYKSSVENNSYYFNLAEQAATNIYLNMKNDKVI